MKSDAIAIANYFVDKSNTSGKGVTLLSLLKLVYIAHGYLLALLDDGGFDPRFDKVEAWKYGPVVPSVYHTFKYNKSNVITERGFVLKSGDDNGIDFITPTVEDESKRIVLDFVWDRYGEMKATDLVRLTHRDDTPWAYCYRVGKNVEIPDELTKLYYEKMIEILSAKP